MKPVFGKAMLFVLIVSAMVMASCASSGAGMGESIDVDLSKGMTESVNFAVKSGEMVETGYTQVVPVEGMDSRYKVKYIGSGSDGKWMTADDQVGLLVRENFLPDGRLLSVETYDGMTDFVVERMENVGFDENAMPVEQAVTKAGERFRLVLEYNSNSECVKVTHYDGSTMMVGVEEFIWTNYWDGDVYVARKYGVTSHGTATPDFVAYRYTDSDKTDLIEVEKYSEEGNLVEKVVVDKNFTGAVNL